MAKPFDENKIRSVVLNSTSMADVMRGLGLRLSGGSHSNLSRKIKALNIDTSHFLGQRKAYTLGLCGHNKISPSGILVKRETGYREKSYKLRRALLESGIDYRCKICTNDGTWNGEKLTLEIDHINNDWLDDRIDNLRFLCPNCHSQR